MAIGWFSWSKEPLILKTGQGKKRGERKREGNKERERERNKRESFLLKLSNKFFFGMPNGLAWKEK